MDPLLIIILVSALVTAFPLIKGAIAKLNAPDGAVAPPRPVFTQPVQQPVQQPVKAVVTSSCLQSLVDLARCLPEQERKDLINKYAGQFVMKELE